MAFVSMKFDGLEELKQKFEALASDKETVSVEKKIISKCQTSAKEKMKKNMPRSLNNAKSGKKGYRPKGHAQDNIPVSKVSLSRGEPKGTVGWEHVNRTDYFYMNMVEWGNSIQKPQDFLYNTISESWPGFNAVAETEMQAFVDEKLG